MEHLNEARMQRHSILMLNKVVHILTTTLYRVNFSSDYLLTLRFSGKRRREGWRNHLPLLSTLKREEASFFELCIYFNGARGGVVAKALRYKPAGRGFDSRWCYWNISVT
jgi:hypothetical protein